MQRRIKTQSQTTLNRRIIYILPTRNGLFFLLSTALIFIGAINYAVSLAYALAFLMISVFVLSILHAFNNLNQLSLSTQPCLPVFKGEEAAFRVLLSRSSRRTHEAIELGFDEHPPSHADLVENDQVQVNVFTPARYRGNFKAPRLKVTSYFPLGLCRAWSVVDLDMHCLVYPKPVACVMSQFQSGASGSDDSTTCREGSEDFYGVRDYMPGDSMRQVSWKNVARGQGLQVKQFVDYADSRVWLDWDMFYGFSVEERLSRLCYCALKLAKSGNPYGLKMPGVEIAPGTGTAHRNKILKALALYESV